METPTPGEPRRSEILFHEHKAKSLGGVLDLFVPGSRITYHYHQNRESVMVFINDEGTGREEFVTKADFDIEARLR